MASRVIQGESPAIQELLQLISKFAHTKTNVLIMGESGTGKELAARLIHDSGSIKNKPFIAVNCGAIPETLMESEFFGHVRGSFTGAIADKPGFFEAAQGGTLFLDEVGEIPLAMQVKLLRAIQERTIRRVGGTENIQVDVRIIAATNRDLEKAVSQGVFREDLYYRLNVLLLKTPSLRDRKGDIDLLAKYFCGKFAERAEKKISGISPEALKALEAYPWPGNVRELENILERAVMLESGSKISVASLPEGFLERSGLPSGVPVSPPGIVPDLSRGSVDLPQVLKSVERAYLLGALKFSNGVKKTAAELLGISVKEMRERMKRLGMGV